MQKHIDTVSSTHAFAEMSGIFSDRISGTPESFIREILKVISQNDIISFAGGLPNKDLFPVPELRSSCLNVFDGDEIESALQYSATEGDVKLREWISNRYQSKHGLDVAPDDILITTGSQQGLDLLGKILINENDDVVIEEPGYLGAIQAFSIYQPTFHAVPLLADGLDAEGMKKVLDSHKVKLFYTVPNFQNPSGLTYSKESRERVADLLRPTDVILIEDNPYGELRFKGESAPSFYSLIPENTVLLGSFSKTVVPAFRLGWVVAKGAIREKLVIAKQASDLHSNYFSQKILADYLLNNDLDEHISLITEVYGRQRDAMVGSIKKHFPESVQYTEPEGGMFLWVTLPENISAMKLFDKAIEQKVAFVPGDPFYLTKKDVNTFRLNYSCVDEETIERGISILGEAIRSFL